MLAKSNHSQHFIQLFIFMAGHHTEEICHLETCLWLVKYYDIVRLFAKLTVALTIFKKHIGNIGKSIIVYQKLIGLLN